MPVRAAPDRSNQRHRTRKDLLSAATRLLKSGRAPDMDEVAREAMVSRATAYRYFPTIESLLLEAPLDGVVPDPASFFDGDTSTDPVARVDKAESQLHEMCYRNEASLRLMIAASLERIARGEAKVPVRQNRRTAIIEAALAPARHQFSRSEYQKLISSLVMVFGPESMIALGDVLGLDEKAARKIKSWTIKTLVSGALAASQATQSGR